MVKKIISLAVVLLFLVSGASWGAIVYSGSQNVTVALDGTPSPGSEQAGIQIAGQPGGWDDFTVRLQHNIAMPPNTQLSLREGLPMTMVMPTPTGVVGGMGVALPVSLGNLIGGASSYDPDPSWLLSMGQGGSVIGGSFGAAGGYIGLRMVDGVDTYYGWLHMAGMTDIGMTSQSVFFDGWAYDNVVGTAIAAGDTGLPAVPVPGALVLGGFGAGLVTWLRRRRMV